MCSSWTYTVFLCHRDKKIERSRREREAQLLEECTFIPSYSSLASSNPQDIIDQVDRNIVASNGIGRVPLPEDVDSSDDDLPANANIPSIGTRRRAVPPTKRPPQEPPTPPPQSNSIARTTPRRGDYLYNNSSDPAYQDGQDSINELQYPLPQSDFDSDINEREIEDDGYGYDSMRSQRGNIQHPALYMHNGGEENDNDEDNDEDNDDDIDKDDVNEQWHDEVYPPLPPDDDDCDEHTMNNKPLNSYFSSSVVGAQSHRNSHGHDNAGTSYNYTNKSRALSSDTDDFDSMSLLEQLASTDFIDHSDNYSSAYELEDSAYQQQLKAQLQEQYSDDQDLENHRWQPHQSSMSPQEQEIVWQDSLDNGHDDYSHLRSPPSPAPPQSHTPIILKKRMKDSTPRSTGTGSTRRRPPPTPVAAEGSSRERSYTPNKYDDRNISGGYGSGGKSRGSYNIDIL